MSAQPLFHSQISVVLEREGIAAVCLEGEFDVSNVGALRDQVDQALAEENNLILDLSQATFIDSSVIQTLYSAAQRFGGRDQAVVVQLGTAPIVERALQIAGIERVLPRVHDRDEAIQLIQGPS